MAKSQRRFDFNCYFTRISSGTWTSCCTASGEPESDRTDKAYLNYTKPTDMNIIVDEMLAIRDEIDAWKEKKAGIESNQSYNELIYYGLERENGTDGD